MTWYDIMWKYKFSRKQIKLKLVHTVYLSEFQRTTADRISWGEERRKHSIESKTKTELERLYDTPSFSEGFPEELHFGNEKESLGLMLAACGTYTSDF